MTTHTHPHKGVSMTSEDITLIYANFLEIYLTPATAYLTKKTNVNLSLTFPLDVMSTSK